MKKIKPISFSFIISLAISFLFLLITFWIFYQYSWSAAAAKDALSTTGSYFGAVATLGASVVAAYLFNDWREQKVFDLKIEVINEILTMIDHLEKNLDVFYNGNIGDFTRSLKYFFKLYKIIDHNKIGLDIDKKYNDLHQDVSKILLNSQINGHRELWISERHKIMEYRGYITGNLRKNISDKKFEILDEI
ncbi:hypothetical protein [uncultured Acinetobacter sp.]|uniref:hypothetical protein n=1 Tax=uncultured Acinetobacter sp. TaxID=165433 RepID=UPI002589B007|nr:hypothetical protein [uncultured Acinetobacter sp.]